MTTLFELACTSSSMYYMPAVSTNGGGTRSADCSVAILFYNTQIFPPESCPGNTEGDARNTKAQINLTQ